MKPPSLTRKILCYQYSAREHNVFCGGFNYKWCGRHYSILKKTFSENSVSYLLSVLFCLFH